MPLVAESAWNATAWHGGDDQDFSMTFDLDFPPQAAFIKVMLGEYFQWIDTRNFGAASIGLINMRRRKPDNSDETITFPNIGVFETVYCQFDPAMTHVTFGIVVRECSASLVWTLGIWA
jgi:hypothetical protein